MSEPPALPERARPHIVARNAQERVRRINHRSRWHQDLYHRTLSLPWYWFLAIGCVFYLGINVVFAALYLLQPGGIAGAAPGSILDAFFFSVETIATIGYGQMYPQTVYTNVLMTIETMTGLILVALATGVTFARISRPTARVMFARVAVVNRYNGVPTLTFRLANERLSQILEADVSVSLLRFETSQEGVRMRRFYDLALIRSHTPVFALSFSIMHPIDESSPLFGMTDAALVAEEVELLVTVTGLEEVTSQTVHARHSYDAGELRFGHRYADMFTTGTDGTFTIDYGRFDDTEPLPSDEGRG